MIHGIINVYKEKGYTSHDVVARLRGILGQKRIGHTGTLDPDAEGVLPVCLGKATKVCELLADWDKTYRAILLLGQVTDTQDVSGEILETREVTASIKEVYEAIQSFKGEYAQVPPMYSALKVNGKKLYELAREGKTVERKARNVQIHEIKIHEIVLPRISMTVNCSKGTYIRTLCHDIGQKVGCGGCMEQLLRTQVGMFRVEESLRLDEIEVLHDLGQLQEHMAAIDSLFSLYPAVTVKQEYQKLLDNGNELYGRQVGKQGFPGQDGPVRMYGSDGNFQAVYEYLKKENRFRPMKMF
ncbi:MAG: tRNA pseudouridine(55) synthase TruB [Lachnospiraceae bacterium]|uniref:tRNA pseudouridine(55) synthase TruB n=1 Tax=Hominisplanchenecus murintestinalis TaxID=2941517 RepID=A0AC61R305_9FIRM|nr:tRNA pseudouridine(55) synthase TruB [Hominisplanchenecus murintestinalis]MCI9515816.1 tRNA pseudouridine(55) synthase TruB [Lachnospiraceae bacterium]RKJ97649.1 tRNA pseudouridine(55) synthase TruB [Anaerotruncus sp. 1XD22-93]MCI9660239.1 tRNA pseudouridine(55) synthase TruB [Lachnospiraceae bacterium]MDE6907902.1 tRNA pseudouridine(55) synthase TruB [Lachnospiraceae bacterium]NBH97489.1 tRNA pseudouridine(55) synthase TruB [Lachnospiraceae bacterium]